IDECHNQYNFCNQRCTNTIGSYSCSCNTGYELLANEHDCFDINECELNNGDCDHNCTNTIGSNIYQAIFLIIRIALDIDECLPKDKCEGICHNTKGSYECKCQTGYYLGDDNYTCLEIKVKDDSSLATTLLTTSIMASQTPGDKDKNVTTPDTVCINQHPTGDVTYIITTIFAATTFALLAIILIALLVIIKNKKTNQPSDDDGSDTVRKNNPLYNNHVFVQENLLTYDI
ncbi:PREDICTED: signal peptide, CUB and EGF-like domain-containing protein 3, partial [Amphimedon queenslandica]|uniref:EGF-like domain-containing protein n=1 Tax=Amphimedon queenslandica TaxID=400682 RepID=A0AAN0IT02_AMPQE